MVVRPKWEGEGREKKGKREKRKEKWKEREGEAKLNTCTHLTLDKLLCKVVLPPTVHKVDAAAAKRKNRE